MDNLPIEITLYILSDLPTVLQLQCRKVCKTWRTLLKPKTGLLFLEKTFIEAQLHFSEHILEQLSCIKTFYIGYRRRFRPSRDKLFMVGSCNGLVCYAGYASSRRTGSFKRITRVFICNPLMGEQIQLRKVLVQLDGKVWAELAIGFGYSRSSNEYKFVRILRNRRGGVEWVHMSIVQGGAGWSTKSKSIADKHFISFHLSNVLPSVGVYAGGALHWIDDDPTKRRIVSFDLEHERFSLLPLIPSVVQNANVKLMALGGNLCVLEVAPFKHVKIWELIRNKKTVKYKPKKDCVYTWLMKFSIAGEECWGELIRSDRCLLWYNVIISCYDSETKTFRIKLNETLEKIMLDSTSSVYTTTEATPFVYSLVSLKGKYKKRLPRKQK